MTTISRDPGRRLICPPWCTADHDEQQHWDGRWHLSTPLWLPVVELQTISPPNGPMQFEDFGIELTVGIEQRVDGDELYISVDVSDDRERGFRLSLDSTRRLTVALSAVLHYVWGTAMRSLPRRDVRSALWDEVCDVDVEHVAERDEGVQRRVGGNVGSGEPLLQLGVCCAGDARGSSKLLLAQPCGHALAVELEAEHARVRRPFGRWDALGHPSTFTSSQSPRDDILCIMDHA